MTKYQRLQGYDSKVIIANAHDKYGIKRFYRDYILTVKPEEFLETYFSEAESADVIHVHSLIGILIRTWMKFGRSKKLILHYHGTDIRRLYNPIKRPVLPSRGSQPISDIILNPRQIASKIAGFVAAKKHTHLLAQRLAGAVLVSTPDLLRLVPKAVHLPNPVDSDHFKPSTTGKNAEKEGLTINTEAIDIQTPEYYKKYNLNLDIEVHDRANNPIMYADMPAFLRSYKIYVDIRNVNQKILENLSKTALESLACGLIVLDYQLKYRKYLPPEHHPQNVVSRLSTIYLK